MNDKDYKINLPKTDFPMKANLPDKEPKILEHWQQIKLQEKMAAANLSRKNKFILHDGPPYANGDIHVGHAYNKIFKDIVNKDKFMHGYATPYIPGWDCHGLPIELNTEKKFGKVGDKITAIEFIAACRKYAEEQIQSQKADFIRLGVLGDWENPYKTMNFNYEANIIRALAKIIKNGYLIHGQKPVHWCIACGSALAEAEVEYQDKASSAIDIRFSFVDPQKLLANTLNILDVNRFSGCGTDRPEQFELQQGGEERAPGVYGVIHEECERRSQHSCNSKCDGYISIPVWTTTPWTLPANEAVALHPALTYALVTASNNEHFLILDDLLSTTMQRYAISEYKIIKTYLGKDLSGMLLQHPFLDKQVPIILGEHVTTDAGTGAVHTAPAHGMEDYVVGKQYKLPVENPVGTDGKFLPNTPYFAGKNVFAANNEVIALLKERGNLLHHTTIQHSYPHCWRHKTPLIFRATPQWFISMEQAGKYGKLREIALTEIEKINWLTEHGKNRITNMINSRPDWCISRQRVWGSPMTIFVDKQSGQLHPQTDELIEKIAQEIEKVGIVFWRELDVQNFLKQNSNTQKYPAENYEKVKDTLDVWFDSGVSHECVLQQRDELNFPADLYLEGSDQYRGWFQSSLLTSLAINGTAPYKDVLSHGFTVDGSGHKMSKSLGNVVSPQKTIKTHGADILRWWVASSNPSNEIGISDEILKGCVDIYRSLRNTMRYMLGNLYDFNPRENLVPFDNMLDLDKWIIYTIQNRFIKQMESDEHNKNYDFHFSCTNIIDVAKNLLSNCYFDIIKDRLYTMPANSIGRRSAQTALYNILEMYVRLLAPILSFTAEEVWQNMRAMFGDMRKESIFLEEKYTIAIPDGQKDWSKIWAIRENVTAELEKLRVAKVIGANLAASVFLYCNDEIYNLLQKFTPQNSKESELRFVFITSCVEIFHENEKPQDAVEASGIQGVWLKAIPSPHPKCPRCWHYRPQEEFGTNNDYPELCSRCVTNITTEEGENRLFA